MYDPMNTLTFGGMNPVEKCTRTILTIARPLAMSRYAKRLG